MTAAIWMWGALRRVLRTGEADRPYPVVTIHGNGQTGNNSPARWTGGRGWAHDFLRVGYTVYVADQPARGRSGQCPSFYGDYVRRLGGNKPLEARFTAPETAKLRPQAERHTQWPGTGQRGDPSFDQFFASQVESLADGDEAERLNQQAGAALLDRIGPAIVMVHSQLGAFGWLIADAAEAGQGDPIDRAERPALLRCRIQGRAGMVRIQQYAPRKVGIARIPLTYDRPAATPEALRYELEDAPPADGLVRCYRQAEPARQLPNLKASLSRSSPARPPTTPHTTTARVTSCARPAWRTTSSGWKTSACRATAT